MTDTSTKAVERLAQEYDKRVALFKTLASGAGSKLRLERGKETLEVHEATANALRTLLNERDELKAMGGVIGQLAWWNPSKQNNYTHGAKTIFGTYYVGICGGRHYAWIELFHESGRIEQWEGEVRGSLFQAKMDAQRHYKARIRSAFVTPPQDAIAKTVTEIWDRLESECWDVRCRAEPIADTGDSDTVWEVISHHMSKPFERVEGTGSTPQEAFAEAIYSGEGYGGPQ